MVRSSDGRLKSPQAHSHWSAMEDFVLESLVGKVSFRAIALRLGRKPSAVQRRASAKGWSARKHWAGDRTRRREQVDALTEARLSVPESELADYL